MEGGYRLLLHPEKLRRREANLQFLFRQDLRGQKLPEVNQARAWM